MPWWKRRFDLVITLSALVLLTPVIAVLALLVRVKLGALVFFRQQRPGLHGKPFGKVKFRTMTDACDASGALLPDADRPPLSANFSAKAAWTNGGGMISGCKIAFPTPAIQCYNRWLYSGVA